MLDITMIPETMTFSHKAIDEPLTITMADLSATSVAFIMDYGLRQYLADGAAASLKDGDRYKTDQELKDEKSSGVHKRHVNLISGTFPKGGGGRSVDPIFTALIAIVSRIRKDRTAADRKLTKHLFPHDAAIIAAYGETLHTKWLARAEDDVAFAADLDDAPDVDADA